MSETNYHETIAELKERIVWLESELGMSERVTEWNRVRTALNVQSGQSIAVLMALYAAKGRTLGKYHIFEIMPHGSDGTHMNVVDVIICRLRKSLGFAAIETVRNEGFRMTEIGRALVQKAIEGTLSQAA